MKKVAVETFIGFVLTVSGLILACLLLGGIIPVEISYWPIVFSLIATFLGVYLFIKASRRDIYKRHHIREHSYSLDDLGSNKLLDRNNKLITDYHKTNQLRDKLKLLKLSAQRHKK